MENKKLILLHLLATLRRCRNYTDLKSLEYVEDGYMEFVDIVMESGYTRRVNVTADSGIAMISDIVKVL